MKHFPVIISLILLTLVMTPASAKKRDNVAASAVDSVRITFGPAQWELDSTLGDNAAVLEGIHNRLNTVVNDSLYRWNSVTVIGGASPDGSLELNNRLSEQRAQSLFNWFERYNHLPDVEKSVVLLGRDWAGLLRLARQADALPYKDETIELLETIVAEKEALNGAEPANSLERLKALHDGVPYRYLYENIFPALRESTIIVSYDRILAPEAADSLAQTGKKFYMDVRTNMLYDAAALPNIGVDFYVGKNFSVGANWMYGWWNSKKRFRYWRAYGGELNARWWFGKAAHIKPLTGHHVGLYGQIYTYDFQWGGKGQMGGEPGKNLWHRFFWGAGIDYGYSLPVARRINIDFSLGLGYTTGTYYKYHPLEGHNVWLSTHKRHYWGPTKLEIALVWLIGNGNYNEKKGGNQ